MIKIDNNIDTLECVDALIRYYFHCSFNDLELLEDGVYYAYDTSFHGSPHYQYKLITNDKKLVNIYKSLVKLRELILTY